MVVVHRGRHGGNEGPALGGVPGHGLARLDLPDELAVVALVEVVGVLVVAEVLPVVRERVSSDGGRGEPGGIGVAVPLAESCRTAGHVVGSYADGESSHGGSGAVHVVPGDPRGGSHGHVVKVGDSPHFVGGVVVAGHLCLVRLLLSYARPHSADRWGRGVGVGCEIGWRTCSLEEEVNLTCTGEIETHGEGHCDGRPVVLIGPGLATIKVGVGLADRVKSVVYVGGKICFK